MKSVVSQVPKCKGPGAPIAVFNLHPETRATRPRTIEDRSV